MCRRYFAAVFREICDLLYTGLLFPGDITDRAISYSRVYDSLTASAYT